MLTVKSMKINIQPMKQEVEKKKNTELSTKNSVYKSTFYKENKFGAFEIYKKD